MVHQNHSFPLLFKVSSSSIVDDKTEAIEKQKEDTNRTDLQYLMVLHLISLLKK